MALLRWPVTLAIHFPTGKKKHDRLFWVDGPAGTISWDKKQTKKPNKGPCRLDRVQDGLPPLLGARAWFDKIDADGSGELDREELAALYKEARGEKLSKKQLKTAMAEMDTDGSGSIDFAEFEGWLQRLHAAN